MNSFEAQGDTRSTTRKKNRNCKRMIFTECNSLPLSDGSHKFHEKILFIGKNDSNLPLAIGLNPAKGDADRFDSTNRYLAKYFYGKGYDGYLLYNVYTVVQPNGHKLTRYIESHPDDTLNDFQDELVKILLFTSCDVYLFWRKNSNNTKLINNAVFVNLIKLLYSTRNIYYSFSKKGTSKAFVHPGAAKMYLDFDIITANNLNLVF